MNVLAFVFAAWLLGMLTGLPIVPLFTKLSRLGKSFFVCINPRTKALDIRWARPRGEAADFRFADDTPKSVALDGPLSHTHKNARAFLVNTQAGVAFNVETVEPFTPELDPQGKPLVVPAEDEDGKKQPNAGMLVGKPGKVRTPHLNGARLNSIRKDTRVQQIAMSNRIDLGLLAKVAIVLIVVFGLVGVGTLFVVSQAA